MDSLILKLRERVSMIIKKTFLFTFLFCISLNAFSASDIKNYNSMCDLIQDVMKLDIKPQARLNYINKHFNSRVGAKDVKEAYDLIFQISPNQRYQVFKQSVESATNQTWTCPALNDFFN